MSRIPDSSLNSVYKRMVRKLKWKQLFKDIASWSVSENNQKDISMKDLYISSSGSDDSSKNSIVGEKRIRVCTKKFKKQDSKMKCKRNGKVAPPQSLVSETKQKHCKFNGDIAACISETPIRNKISNCQSCPNKDKRHLNSTCPNLGSKALRNQIKQSGNQILDIKKGANISNVNKPKRKSIHEIIDSLKQSLQGTNESSSEVNDSDVSNLCVPIDKTRKLDKTELREEEDENSIILSMSRRRNAKRNGENIMPHATNTIDSLNHLQQQAGISSNKVTVSEETLAFKKMKGNIENISKLPPLPRDINKNPKRTLQENCLTVNEQLIVKKQDRSVNAKTPVSTLKMRKTYANKNKRRESEKSKKVNGTMENATKSTALSETTNCVDKDKVNFENRRNTAGDRVEQEIHNRTKSFMESLLRRIRFEGAHIDHTSNTEIILSTRDAELIYLYSRQCSTTDELEKYILIVNFVAKRSPKMTRYILGLRILESLGEEKSGRYNILTEKIEKELTKISKVMDRKCFDVYKDYAFWLYERLKKT